MQLEFALNPAPFARSDEPLMHIADGMQRPENVTLNMIGRAKKVSTEKENTTIIDGVGRKSEIDSRVEQICAQIEETSSDYDREKL